MRFIVLGINALLAVWIAYDANQRKISTYFAFLIGLFAFLFPIITIPIYFLVRTKISDFTPKKEILGPTTLCPKCGHDNPPNSEQCQKCGNQLTL